MNLSVSAIIISGMYIGICGWKCVILAGRVLCCMIHSMLTWHNGRVELVTRVVIACCLLQYMGLKCIVYNVLTVPAWEWSLKILFSMCEVVGAGGIGSRGDFLVCADGIGSRGDFLVCWGHVKPGLVVFAGSSAAFVVIQVLLLSVFLVIDMTIGGVTHISAVGSLLTRVLTEHR